MWKNCYETWIEPRSTDWMSKAEAQDYLNNRGKFKYAKNIKVIQAIDVTQSFDLTNTR